LSKLAASAAVILAGLAGCSAPEACVEERWSGAPNLMAEQLSGAVSLDATQQPAQQALDLKLTGLPELWQGSKNVFGGGVTVSITTEYASKPPGNDGKTEMPRVAATLGLEQSDRTVTASTSTFPSGSSSSDELRLFENCDDEDPGPGCCAYGSRECSVPLRIDVDRLDGAPFPAVAVSWSAQASASVTSCPLEKPTTVELTLEEASR
jgi:hypothetical protein